MACALTAHAKHAHAIIALAEHVLQQEAIPYNLSLVNGKACMGRQLQCSMAEGAKRGDKKGTHHILRKLTRAFRRPLPAVKLASGQLAMLEEQAARRWLQHARNLHAGECVLPAHLLGRIDALRTSALGCARSPSSIPSCASLAAILRRAMAGRSPGLDMLSPDLFKSFPAELGSSALPIAHQVRHSACGASTNGLAALLLSSLSHPGTPWPVMEIVK